ncbi:hypothetical protein BDN71DRAFT_1451461 [Pleurotus eryngii]|uniref:Uncharacterized protein n=1 Tax=Pleurotus eryngii TaxID=5323 RepID=A0A9P5ZRV3_PLEER|nr:hypothetical protein BDN71DRAFT_1451461 [Pleurotus eryngii]
MWRNVSSPLLGASPRQLPSDSPVPASRRNNQPLSNPRGRSLIQSILRSLPVRLDLVDTPPSSRAFSFVYPEPIISRTRLHSQQSTERISSFTAMFPPPSTLIARPNSDIESRPLVPCCALPMGQYRRTVIGWTDGAIDQERVHSSRCLKSLIVAPPNPTTPTLRGRPSKLQPADGRSTARRSCAYRGAYRDIDINTSGFSPSRLVMAVWALFLVRNEAMVPRGHGRFFHGCRLLWTRALLGLLVIRVYCHTDDLSASA